MTWVLLVVFLLAEGVTETVQVPMQTVCLQTQQTRAETG